MGSDASSGLRAAPHVRGRGASRDLLSQPSPWADGMALPVAVSGPGHVVTQVSAWVESRLGWQVTDGGPLPPVARLVAPGNGVAVTSGDAIPSIALVGPDDDPMAAARLAAACDGVVAWPAGHDDLPGVVARLVAAGPARRTGLVDVERQPGSVGWQGAGAGAGAMRRHGDPGGIEALVVGGATGGVGTTTVAVTLAAWHVWGSHGGRAMAVVSGPAPVVDAGIVEREVLAGHRGWAASTPVPGVDGLRVVRSRGAMRRLSPPAGVATVVDVGVVSPADEEVDVLVVRRDAAGLAALRDSPCGSVAIADDGPVTRGRMLGVADGRRVVFVPWSIRVARAHALQRLPGSAPGRYARAVGALLADDRDVGRPTGRQG